VDVRVVRPVTVFLAWLLLAAGAAAGTSFAIDYAGRQVGGKAAPPDVVLPTPVGASPTPSSTTVPSGTPSATASPGGTPSSSASPSPSPSQSGTERGMHNIDAGGLVVRCAGTAVAYWAVRPAPGWQADTAQKSASVLEVVFTRPRDRRVVGATCGAAGPIFSGDGA
jgi:hypothetical protein